MQNIDFISLQSVIKVAFSLRQNEQNYMQLPTAVWSPARKNFHFL